MAGVTHSAFRRLVADFGGYGALFTEMLCAPAVLRETFANSPYVRRRPEEGPVFYQLLIGDTDRLDRIMERVRSFEPAGVDVNLACGARDARRMGGGSALFDDPARMERVLTAVRERFDGPLTAKIRLGRERGAWQDALQERGRILRNSGVDAVILHPRFAGEKFRRHARYGHVPWAIQALGLPVVVSGDLTGPDTPEVARAREAGASGIMIGRMAAVRPWIFASWRGAPAPPNLGEVWERLCRYVEEDFEPPRRLSRIKIFTEYFARNFRFGHWLFARVQSAPTVAEARRRAAEFWASSPEPVEEPSVMGIS